MQAAGLGGGTEHASAIFYGEKGVASGRAPVVHEVAHQWWGNAVTEKDWDDVWLSEGFATYFTHLYAEQYDGHDAFVRGLRGDVKTILNAQKSMPDQPIVHRNLSDMSRCSTASSIRRPDGCCTCCAARSVPTLLDRYPRVLPPLSQSERVDRRFPPGHGSGQPACALSWFFEQWLTRPGLPSLRGSWRYDAAAKQIRIDLAQVQTGGAYRLPIEFGIARGSGQTRVERAELTAATSQFTFAADTEPASVILDPDTWLLLSRSSS